jgi:hypothetical protein
VFNILRLAVLSGVLISTFAYSQALQSVCAIDSIKGFIVTVGTLQALQDTIGTPGLPRLFVVVQDRLTRRVLAMKDIGHPYYGGDLWSAQRLQLEMSSDGVPLILFQTAFGGDGEHTSNYLIMCAYKKANLTILLKEELSDVRTLVSGHALRGLSGRRVFSLCHVCDGNDAASEEDLFYIPVSVTFNGTRIAESCTLSPSQKRTVLSRFVEQGAANTKEQYSYSAEGGRDYERFVRELEKELRAALQFRDIR